MEKDIGQKISEDLFFIKISFYGNLKILCVTCVLGMQKFQNCAPRSVNRLKYNSELFCCIDFISNKIIKKDRELCIGMNLVDNMIMQKIICQ